jgi:hypothetical protein
MPGDYVSPVAKVLAILPLHACMSFVPGCCFCTELKNEVPKAWGRRVGELQRFLDFRLNFGEGGYPSWFCPNLSNKEIDRL